jgi:hypothetical protein
MPAGPAQPRSAGLGARLLGPLLRLFGRGKKSPPQAIDRTPYRQRALDLLQEMQAARAGDVAALRLLAGKLEQLFHDLVKAGDRDDATRRLGEAAVEADTLLAQAAPPEDAMRALLARVEAALKDWLALVPGAPQPSPSDAGRKEFWK